MSLNVALVTPSLNRPQWHEQLYAQFVKQVGLASKHLYVLDESAEPSPFFSTPRDGVTYVQQAGKPRVDGVTRIGEARNALNALVKEPIIVHVDDDDLLDPDYCATMCERLGDADVAKLDVWRLIKDDDSVIFEWDTRSLGGQHYAMKGDVVEPVVIDPKEMTTEEHQAWQSAWRDGFGWSMVYTRAIWEKVKFAVEGTEDSDWVRRVRAAGGKIRFISDLPHLALHTVHVDPNHGEGGSAHFPQRVLGKLQGRVKERMLGAGAPMQELPREQAIEIQPGVQYDLVAILKKSHSLREIATRAAQWGITVQQAVDNVDPAANGVAAPPSGYRLVRVSGSGSKKVTLPWAAPKMLQVLGEKSAIERAWIGAGNPADEDDVMFVRVFVGAAAAHETLGPKGRDPSVMDAAKAAFNRHEAAAGTGGMSPEDAAVSEYDPERYKGREPPHRCTIASSTAIAQQLPGAPWAFEQSFAPEAKLPWPTRKEYFDITTPAGKKNAPAQFTLDGKRLVMTCPYSGQQFVLVHGPPRLGAGKAYVAPPNAPPPVPTPAQFTLLRSRPDPSSEPDVLNAWLNANPGISPYWAYPEFGWYPPDDPSHPETAFRADYEIPLQGAPPGISNGHVWWWLQKDGSWGYDHEWGDNLAKTLEQLADATALVAQAFGIAGASQLVYTLHALAGNGSPSMLAASLKADYANFQTSEDLAKAVQNGDWSKVWDQVTKSGTELGDLKNVFAGGNAPDRLGNLTIPGNPLPPTGQCPPGQTWNGNGCSTYSLVYVPGPQPKGKVGTTKKTGGSSGWAIVGAIVGAAAVTAGGVGVYAWRSGQSYGDAWKRVLGIAGDQATASGKLLAAANPQRLVLKA